MQQQQINEFWNNAASSVDTYTATLRSPPLHLSTFTPMANEPSTNEWKQMEKDARARAHGTTEHAYKNRSCKNNELTNKKASKNCNDKTLAGGWTAERNSGFSE